MKTLAPYIHSARNRNNRTTALLRLTGALALYICFGLLTEYAYASKDEPEPLE